MGMKVYSSSSLLFDYLHIVTFINAFYLDGVKILDKDMEELIKNVVDLNIDEAKTVNQASNFGCA